MFVCDMDGNVLVGYTLAPGQTLSLNQNDDPKRQAIPFGLSLTQINKLAATGILQTGIFAQKTMDARLPQSLVELVNEGIARGEPFRLAFLTSRSREDALILLRESGVTDPKKVTLVADSGATLSVLGQLHDVYTPTLAEQVHLAALENMTGDLKGQIQQALKAQGFDETSCPDLFVERKHIAWNLHHRAILEHYGQAENSVLDKTISDLVYEAVDQHAAQGGWSAETGLKVFKALRGPATVEMKIATINKGMGLDALANVAHVAGQMPTNVVFSGDDVANAAGAPGTDYYGMAQSVILAEKYNVPFHNILTLHPKGGDLTSFEPDLNKSPNGLKPPYQAPQIALVVRTPADMQGLISDVLGQGGQVAAKKPEARSIIEP